MLSNRNWPFSKKPLFQRCQVAVKELPSKTTHHFQSTGFSLTQEKANYARVLTQTRPNMCPDKIRSRIKSMTIKDRIL